MILDITCSGFDDFFYYTLPSESKKYYEFYPNEENLKKYGYVTKCRVSVTTLCSQFSEMQHKFFKISQSNKKVSKVVFVRRMYGSYIK